MTDDEIIQSAIVHAKSIRAAIASEFTCKVKYPPTQTPSSIFMAGSPGAGKTEVAKELERISYDVVGKPVIRIDPDEFRAHFSNYNGSNSHLFQRAIIPIVERVLDKVLINRQEFILDGTLSNFDIAKKNISRSLDRERDVDIFYVFQEPEISWKFVLAREVIEGRRILPETFVDQFFSSRSCVNLLKQEFGDKISVNLVVKNYDQSVGNVLFGIQSIDEHIGNAYNPRDLLELIYSLM